MSDYYKCRPSDILYIDDDYTAYCFNEACLIISLNMQEGKIPKFITVQDTPVGARKNVTPMDVYGKFMRQDEQEGGN